MHGDAPWYVIVEVAAAQQLPRWPDIVVGMQGAVARCDELLSLVLLAWQQYPEADRQL